MNRVRQRKREVQFEMFIKTDSEFSSTLLGLQVEVCYECRPFCRGMPSSTSCKYALSCVPRAATSSPTNSLSGANMMVFHAATNSEHLCRLLNSQASYKYLTLLQSVKANTRGQCLPETDIPSLFAYSSLHGTINRGQRVFLIVVANHSHSALCSRCKYKHLEFEDILQCPWPGPSE